MPEPSSIYKFENPEKFPRASVLWVFGSDHFSRNIQERIGLETNAKDILLANDACNRKPEALGKIRIIAGRKAVLEGENFTFAGVNYDSIEIGGFGFQPMETTFSKSMVKINIKNPIALPSANNFARSFRRVTQTEVITDRGKQTLGDDFSFSGAYTLNQVLNKVAANLFLLDKLSQEKQPFFIVPIPISVGYYPDIIGPDGKCAYYIVWKVPYRGKRQGEVPIIDENFRSNEFVSELVNQGPKIAKAVRYLHDLGLTHNQIVPGNYYVSKEKQMLLADFSTIQPLSQKYESSARSGDLTRNIISIYNIMDSYQEPKALKFLYQRTLIAYEIDYFDLDINLSNVGELINKSISHAIGTGKIIARRKDFSKWRFGQIEKIGRELVGE